MRKSVVLGMMMLALLLVSCSKNDYVNTLPKEAQLVLSVDVAEMFAKSGLDDKEIQNEFQQKFVERANDDQKKMLETLLSDPKKIGLDWKEKIYYYVADSEMGLVAAVDDADNLSAFFEQLAEKNEVEKVENDGDFTWVHAQGVLVGYTDERLLAMSVYGDDEVFKQKMQQRLQQSSEQSFAGTEAFKKIEEADADIALYSIYSVLAQWGAKKMQAFLPKDLNPEKMEILLSLHFEKGRGMLSAELFSADKDTQTAIENYTKQAKEQKGTFAECVPADFLVYGSFNCSQEMVDKLLDSNKQIGFVLEMLNRIVPVTDILKSVDGDVAFFVSGNSSMRNPEVMLYARLGKQDVFQHSEGWEKQAASAGLPLKSEGENRFKVSQGRESLYFGLKGEDLYLTNAERYARQVGATYKNERMAPWVSEIKNSYGFFLADLSALQAIPDFQREIPSPLADQLDVLVIRGVKPTKAEVLFTVKEQDENLLKTIVKICLKLV